MKQGLLLPLASMVLLLSGCAGTQKPATIPETPGVAPQVPAVPPPVVIEGTFSWSLAASVPTTSGTGMTFVGSPPTEIEIPENVSIMEVMAEWTCASPTCDLILLAHDPDYNPMGDPLTLLDQTQAAAGYASGTSPLELKIEKPKAGAWTLDLHPNTIALNVEGKLKATLKFGLDGSKPVDETIL